ncbi:AAA family ATPase [Cupriavidus pauculus]|uniref:Uncharacterized protein n=1 Tax=Cupriavidus pauculus TaxID=82633 RepID=A0A2N5C934_9BURK|nr:AAA family ATPase [Cupriavidus pauculus]PLP98745.1 hypothetical protein CYJ10_20845 [Cupriavidus pauculus]
MTGNIVPTVTTPPGYQASQEPSAQQSAQAAIGASNYPNTGHPAQTAPAAQQAPTANPALGLFWDSPPPSAVEKVAAVFTDAFIKKIAHEADRVTAFTLPPAISEEEWSHARLTPNCVVDKFLYEDVGIFVAPGGTGKTTLMLYEAIHIVLGLELFGHPVENAGPVVIFTAEDSRDMLVARLRTIASQMQLSQTEIEAIRQSVVIADVSGHGFKLTAVERDVVVPGKNVERFIRAASELHPAVVFIDPAVSFGVGESRVNDAEQGLIEAGRRIRNALKCAVMFIHHTGKQSARDKATDQYAGRGGSAFADGSRMVHVLKAMDAQEWLSITGDALAEGESALTLARPKISHAPPQPPIYIKRVGHLFTRFEPSGKSSSAIAAVADRVWQIIKDEVDAGRRPTGRSLEALDHGIAQKSLRNAIAWLKAEGRVEEVRPMTTGQRGGAHAYLRAIVAVTPA